MTDPATLSRRRRRRLLWLSAALVFATALFFTQRYFGPPPPREIVLATGEPGGMYVPIGEKYRQHLDRMGLKVRLLGSHGSVDNLRLLLAGQADVALVQAGAYGEVDDAGGRLRGLVAIQWEPVWIFYRGAVVANLAELRNRDPGRKLRVAIGQEASGTEAVAVAILQKHGITAANADLARLSMAETGRALKSGEVDAGFFASSPENEVIFDLMRHEWEAQQAERRPGQGPDPAGHIRLLSTRRQLAYSRHFPYLSPVVLGEGVLDLERNMPDRDVKMFATRTMLVCRSDLHPRAVEQILDAADRVRLPPDLVMSAEKFPTLEGMDVPVHEAAEAFRYSGQSLVTEVLPYWGVRLLYNLQILIIPLLLVWLPFFRVLPFAYTVRINWLLRRHYNALRKAEDRIERATRPEQVEEQIEALNRLRKHMEKVSRAIPTHLQINVYQWRLHVTHVRAEAVERVWHLRQEQRDQKLRAELAARADAPAPNGAAGGAPAGGAAAAGLGGNAAGTEPPPG